LPWISSVSLIILEKSREQLNLKVKTVIILEMLIIMEVSNMNENNGNRFIWLFVGLFIILFAIAGINHIRGTDDKITASMDEMVKAIVESDLVLSDIPVDIPDESQIPLEYLHLYRLDKETILSQKLVNNYYFIYNPNTKIASIFYLRDDGTLLLYTSKEGRQFSEKSFAPFKKEIEQIYLQTLQ